MFPSAIRNPWWRHRGWRSVTTREAAKGGKCCGYCETMKNIAVSVDEALHRLARVRAAELNTSLSALVQGFLEELAGDGSEAERRRRLQNNLLARLDAQGSGVVAAERLDREAVHQRNSPSGPR